MSRKIPIAGILTAFIILISSPTISTQDESAGESLKQMLREAKEQVMGITVEELAELMVDGTDYTLLDIRTEDEYNAGHLHGAVWVPRGKIEFEAASGKFEPREKRLIIYCRIDGRSSLCGQTLKDLGYEQVAYLTGGFMAWAKAGYTIFNRHGELIVKEFEKKEE